jgi:hypothetical protein
LNQFDGLENEKMPPTFLFRKGVVKEVHLFACHFRMSCQAMAQLHTRELYLLRKDDLFE